MKGAKSVSCLSKLFQTVLNAQTFYLECHLMTGYMFHRNPVVRCPFFARAIILRILKLGRNGSARGQGYHDQGDYRSSRGCLTSSPRASCTHFRAGYLPHRPGPCRPGRHVSVQYAPSCERCGAVIGCPGELRVERHERENLLVSRF
jgi:hypothetical protein